MIAKILSGKSLAEAVDYNEQKVREGVAELIDFNNIGSPNCVKETLATVSGYNQRCQKPVFHLSLSFPTEERGLSDSELGQIAKEFMTRFGFGEHPYAVYRHRDTNHPHIHIVSTRISWKGEYKNVHQEHRLAGKISGEIEEKYGLIKVDRSQKKKESKAKRIAPGAPDKNNVRQHITDAITNTLAARNCYDIVTFEERLNSFGVGMDVKEERVSYYLVNDEGKQTTRAIPASSLFIPTQSTSFSPTYKKLNTVFNKQRKAEAAILKKKFSWLQDYYVVSKKAFENFLEKNNLKIKYAENSSGVYGVSFVDTKSNVEFKGSELGCSWAQLSNLLAEKVSVKKGDERLFVENAYKLFVRESHRYHIKESELIENNDVNGQLYCAVKVATNEYFAKKLQTMLDIFVEEQRRNIASIKEKEKKEAVHINEHNQQQSLDKIVRIIAATVGGLAGLFNIQSSTSEQKGTIFVEDEEDIETKIKIREGKLIK